jgi:phosphopantetheinyl transferase
MGKPWICSRVEHHGIYRPSISIAHVEGVAVAIACLEPLSRVGIDVEPIIERSAGFESTAFLSEERALLDRWSGVDRAEWITRFWCAKEALAKATGLGFIEGPSSVEIISVVANGLIGARLRGLLAERCPDLQSRTLRVMTARRDDFAWAWTLAEGMEL